MKSLISCCIALVLGFLLSLTGCCNENCKVDPNNTKGNSSQVSDKPTELNFVVSPGNSYWEISIPGQPTERHSTREGLRVLLADGLGTVDIQDTARVDPDCFEEIEGSPTRKLQYRIVKNILQVWETDDAGNVRSYDLTQGNIFITFDEQTETFEVRRFRIDC